MIQINNRELLITNLYFYKFEIVQSKLILQEPNIINFISSMKISQSKLQSRSTSSSEYFKRRFGQSELHKQHPLSNRNIISYTPSNITSEGSQVFSQYEIFKPSKSYNQPQSHLTNQPLSYLRIQVNQASPPQKKNPFLSSDYNFPYKNQEDSIQENRSSKNTFNPKSKQVKFYNQCQKSSGSYQHFFNANQSQHIAQLRSPTTNRKFSTHQKQNLNSFKKIEKSRKKKTFTNTQLIQPITLIKSSSQKKIINSQLQHLPPQTIFSQNQPHSILEHIYFTISHESNLTKVFKQFANQQKFKINQRFKQTLMQIQNTFNQTKIIFQKKIDQTYQYLLNQLNTLKKMAQLMWKNNIGKKQSAEKNQYTFNLPTKQGFEKPYPQKSRSNSRYTYKKFAQSEVRSPQSNNLLLNQLYEEDQRLTEYKKAKQFYFNDSQLNVRQLDRDKLLKDMNEVSKGIAHVMKQCESVFFDQVNLESRQKHKGFAWFNYVSSSDKLNLEQQDSSAEKQFQNIHSCINRQLSQFCLYVDTFRLNLKHKYIPSTK